METEELLSKSKWAILKELAKGDRSAIEIAKKTGQSTANVVTQLKILEAYGYAKKAKPTDQKEKEAEKEKAKRKVGKPKTPYTLSQEVFATCYLCPGIAEKRVSKLKDIDEFTKLVITIFYTLNPDCHYPLMKYILDAELMQRADTAAYLKSSEKEIELFIITDRLHDIREKHSNLTVQCPDGKTKKIISWSHNKKEVEEGLARNEEYFINLVRNSKALLDRKNNLEELRGLMG